MMSSLSVVTLIKGRSAALRNTMIGLKSGTILPAELVVVHINEEPYDFEPMPFPVNTVTLYSDILLPLAAARNKAMALAAFENVIFLDVDCIPSPDLLDAYSSNWTDTHLLSGQVRYLSSNAIQDRISFDDLDRNSKPDTIREGIDPLPHALFWSLNFGCSKSLFNRIGGFDEQFTGYGAENTDFAFSARDRSIGVKSIDATAYHQYHPSYSPPVNHLEDIVHNAQRFYDKWGSWPMEGWLKKFEKMGLIEWTKQAIHIVRMPTDTELEQCLKD